MGWFRWMAVVLAMSASGRVGAEVTAAAASGFVSEHEVVMADSPARVFEALTDRIADWWDADHSYGGDAQAFYLEARALGCFCERLPEGGSVAHMQVSQALPGKRLVLLGGLGPLQQMGVVGAMTFELSEHAEGTLLSYRYVVSGYAPGGLAAISEPVDRVQLGQLKRLQAFVASRR